MAKTNKKETPDISEEFKTTTSVSDWKKKSKSTGQEMVLPSGSTCIARRVDLMVFMKTGRVPNSLRGMMDQAMGGKEVSEEEVLSKLMEDKEGSFETFFKLMKMVDAVLVDCMIEPRVYAAPEPDAHGENGEEFLRDESLLYTDDIEEEDKMFVFTFAVGGTRDLETFRKGQASNVERILAQQGSGGISQ